MGVGAATITDTIVTNFSPTDLRFERSVPGTKDLSKVSKGWASAERKRIIAAGYKPGI